MIVISIKKTKLAHCSQEMLFILTNFIQDHCPRLNHLKVLLTQKVWCNEIDPNRGDTIQLLYFFVRYALCHLNLPKH